MGHGQICPFPSSSYSEMGAAKWRLCEATELLSLLGGGWGRMGREEENVSPTRKAWGAEHPCPSQVLGGAPYSEHAGCLVPSIPCGRCQEVPVGGRVRTVSVTPHGDPEISLCHWSPGAKWQREASGSFGRCFLCRTSSFLYKWIKFWMQ